MNPLATRMLPTAALVLTAALATACAGSPGSGTDPPTPSAPTTTAATSPASPTDAPATTPTTISFAQACTPEVLLPLMKSKFDNPAGELVIERVDIERCRNGYAHIFAISRRNPTGHPQYENEQLFLHYVDGQWQSVSEGTGISCDDTDLRPEELFSACRALGYRV
jgi:hypothetical protein